jgi:hypothetical protein
MGIILKNVNITGGKLNSTVEVPTASTPVGATLMRTGQTTSYRTGDDANTRSEGRATDFFTLASNNPFGNTNRFTDELGGSTYTNNIVIDWSTYDGTTVLGLYRIAISNSVVWNNAIDNSLALSISTFTSGWRLPNLKELMNFGKYDQVSVFNYSPININLGSIWSSTTNSNNTADALYFVNQTGGIASRVKTNTLTSFRGFACRTFTVTGTTLT